MGKYPAHTDKRRTNWCETLFHLQLIPSQASALGLTHAAEKAARFQPKPWLRAWKARDYAYCGKQKSATNFLPQEILERKAREAGNRSHPRTSASLPIGKQRGRSSPGEDTFPLTDSKVKVFVRSMYPLAKLPKPKRRTTGHRSLFLVDVCVFFAISLLSPMLSSGVHLSSC